MFRLKPFLVCVLGFSQVSVNAFCQAEGRASSRDTLTSSGQLVTQGVELYEKGKFKEALGLYQQVPEGDTNYNVAVYESALTYLADSAFDKSVQMVKKGLQLPDGDRRMLLLTLGSAYDYLGKPDSALYYYDSVARMNPTDHQPVYEKGALFYNKEQNDKAIAYFQAALMINPYHFRSHYMLGCAYAREGRLTEAFIAALNSLLCTNNIEVARNAIVLLDHITKQTTEIAGAYQAKAEKYSHPLYDDIDQVINARLALQKDYKFESVMDEDQLVRVAHMIMEKLKYDRNDTGFVMQFYVPLLRKVYESGTFDPYILILFSGYNIDVIEKYAKRQKKDIQEARDIVFPYLDKILATRVLDYTARGSAKEKYFASSAEGIYITGSMADKKNFKFNAGPVKYYKNGYLLAMGDYNGKSNKQGEWTYLFANGVVRLTEHYNDGVITGEARRYYLNGNLSNIMNYDARGELQEEKEFLYNGILSQKTVISAGKNNVVTSYHLNGNVEIALPHKNDKIEDGHYKSWYSSGAIQKELDLKDGKLTGEYKQFFDNGQLMEISVFKEGENDGPYTSYYDNGKKQYVCNYENGKKDGPYEEYDITGKLTGKGMFSKGKRTLEQFYEGERLYGSIEYKNEKPVAYRFTSENGQVVEERKGDELARLRVFYANGNLRSELPLRNGLTHGPAKYYRSAGGIHELNTYKDDKLDGLSESYFRNGKPSSSRMLRSDRNEYFYRSYYDNGKPNASGWIKDGAKTGQWNFFNANGKPSREIFYLNDEMNGPDKNYLANGQNYYIDYYDKGMLTGVAQFDTNGREFRRESFPKGNGQYKLLYPNGVSYYESTLKNGIYSGEFRKYFSDGTLMSSGYNKSGKQDSIYTAYYINGKIMEKGQYKNNQSEGSWSYFDEDGNLDKEIAYKAGELDGVYKKYINGVLRYEYHYQAGNKTGDQILYGESGKIACVLKYDDDLVGYTYEGKDGKLVPVVPVKNGTAKITALYPNGNKSAELNFVTNMRTGKQSIYYSDGTLAEEISTSDDNYDGPIKRYYPDGKLMYEAVDKDDEIVGEEKYYSPSGELLRSKNYYNGTLNGWSSVTDAATHSTTGIYYHYGHPVAIRK